jgi:hypothetical protein
MVSDPAAVALDGPWGTKTPSKPFSWIFPGEHACGEFDFWQMLQR